MPMKVCEVIRLPDCGNEHGLIPRGWVKRESFAPPLIITEDQIDEMFGRFSRTLDDVRRDFKVHARDGCRIKPGAS